MNSRFDFYSERLYAEYYPPRDLHNWLVQIDIF